jgi:flagellar biogenesis protein FliO
LHRGLGGLIKVAQKGKRLKVLDRITLDQRRALYLVSLDDKELLFGGGEGGVVLLKDLSRPDATSDLGRQSFAGLLRPSEPKEGVS